ncbi:MAG: hypothetical protein ACJATK_000531 [Paracoccaceae bacterium]|jgi:hypothetical protein
MDEAKERLIDKALLNQFDIDPYKKISVGLILVAHRQLQTLSRQTEVSIDDMDREFLAEQLCKTEDAESERTKTSKT